MKRKSSLHSVFPETQSPGSKGKAVDDRDTDAVGRRSFVRKMSIAGASLASVLVLLVASSAMAQNIVTFKGGIGVMPASTVGSANVVKGVQPPGEPWVIRELTAQVSLLDGSIHVDGRGLLLAGGDGIGTNGGQKVFATFVCETVLLSTPVGNAVPLSANGDFIIDSVISPSFPRGLTSRGLCPNPVLLIRSATGNNPWLAAGIPIPVASE